MPGIWSANKSKQRQRNNLLNRHYIAPSFLYSSISPLNNLNMFSGNDSFAWLVQKIFLKHVFWYTKLCLFVDYLIFAAAVACSLPLLETHWEPIVFSISVTCYILYIVLSVFLNIFFYHFTLICYFRLVVMIALVSLSGVSTNCKNCCRRNLQV